MSGVVFLAATYDDGEMKEAVARYVDICIEKVVAFGSRPSRYARKHSSAAACALVPSAAYSDTVSGSAAFRRADGGHFNHLAAALAERIACLLMFGYPQHVV